MTRFYLIIIVLFISHNVFSDDPRSNYSQNNNYQPPPSKKKHNDARIIIDGGYFFPADPSSGPASGYGFGIGYGGGIGIESKDGTIQFRLDLHYYKWTQGNNSYWRTPFFFGIRGFPSRRLKYVLPFFEFGYELSGDKKTVGESDVHFGVTPGAGLEFRFEPISFGVSARYHLIKHPYFTISPYLGFRF